MTARLNVNQYGSLNVYREVGIRGVIKIRTIYHREAMSRPSALIPNGFLRLVSAIFSRSAGQALVIIHPVGDKSNYLYTRVQFGVSAF